MATGTSPATGPQRPHRNRPVTPNDTRTYRGELVVSAVIVAAVVILVVARFTAFPAFTPFTQTLAFYPLVGAGAAILAIIAAARRRWVAAGCLALVALAIAATSWPDIAEPVAAPPGSVSVRVVSSNLNLGAATQPLIDWLAAEPVPADVLFVAECNADCARILGQPPAMALFPHRLIDEAPGAAGSAILSRTPLTELAQQAPNPFAMPSAQVELGGVPVAVKTAHPFPPTIFDLGRWRSGLQELEQFAVSAKTAVIIGGDFNATPYNGAFRSVLGDRLSDAIPASTGTWPADIPALMGTPIDHILFSEPFTMSASGTRNLQGTDHRAVWAELWTQP